MPVTEAGWRLGGKQDTGEEKLTLLKHARLELNHEVMNNFVNRGDLIRINKIKSLGPAGAQTDFSYDCYRIEVTIRSNWDRYAELRRVL